MLRPYSRPRFTSTFTNTGSKRPRSAAARVPRRHGKTVFVKAFVKVLVKVIVEVFAKMF